MNAHHRILSSHSLLLGLLLIFFPTCVDAGSDSVVTFNEIHYNPGEGGGAEWIELHNQMSIRTDISSWTLRGGVNFTFPEGTALEPGAHIVVASVPGTPAGALGPMEGRLNNGGEEIRLHERHGRMMDAIQYGDGDRWPAGADGAGFTLAKRRPELGSARPESWTASTELEGTPGSENFALPPNPQQRPIFRAGGSWKMQTAAKDAMPGWTEIGFEDSDWMTVMSPFATNGTQTLLLRKTFAWLGANFGLQLLFNGVLGTGASARISVNGIRVSDELIGPADGQLSMLLSGSSILVGSNVLAIELTIPEGASDVAFDGALNIFSGLDFPETSAQPVGPLVINEIHYHPRPVYTDEGTAFESQSGAEWIEIVNLSDAPIDLDGWEVGGGIAYTFPASESIAAGAFLVLTDDDFSGSLSNQGERVVLRDAQGGMVDDVHYFDSGRWPEAADGAGSTLELIDPRADNSMGDAWAASDETERSSWNDYIYRATGAEPSGSNNPSTWREFLIGFLDAGEILIDDISVIEDPDGAALELISNGTFDDDTAGQLPQEWRLLGTHKLGKVIADPAGGGNVLHLIATGEQTHTYNAASITLANNRVINRRGEYEIRFRAKWLSGSPQINTRLYLNRAARTHILAQSVDAGTAGAPNSRLAADGNVGPIFNGVRHIPAVPDSGEPVFIVASANDPDEVAAVSVIYRIDGEEWQETAMAAGEDGNYLAILPGHDDRTVVQFYLRGSDGTGVEATFPKGGAEARALYRVGDDRVSDLAVKNNLRLVMLDEDADAMHERIHVVSNHRWGGTVIYNDRAIYYDVAVRLRSAPYGRQGRPGWNIRFGDETPFRGVHGTTVIDGALNVPRGDGTGWVSTTAGASINEMLFNVVANRAGGIAATIDDIVYFAGARRSDHRYAQLKMMRYEDPYLDEIVPNGSEGNLYKQELIYYPTSTVNGRPDGLKNAYNMVNQVDIRNLGVDKNAYRFNYLLRNNRARDDFASIIRMCESFSSTATLRSEAINEVIDVDNWMRTLALNALLGVADTYNNGLAHNLVFYSRPDDGRVMIFPWDLDHAFYYDAESSIFGRGTHRVKTLIDQAPNKRVFRGHLLDICSTAFSNDYLDPWVEHLHEVADQNYATRFKRWISDRREYVLAQIESDSPPVEFEIDDDFPTENEDILYTMRGRGWIDVHTISLFRNGRRETLDVTWLNGQRWEAQVPLHAGNNTLKIEAVNYRGDVVGSDEITVAQTGSTLPAVAGALILSELMYHPKDPSETEIAAGFTDPEMFEFVEVANVSDDVLDLEGCRFVKGIDFIFPAVTLAPGKRAVIVSNATAFITRYGGNASIVGLFTGSLANGGERLRLDDRANFAIDDFEYNDRLPWPPEADGNGYSLTRIETAGGAHVDRWRPSALPGGNPGATDAEALSDYPDLAQYAFGETQQLTSLRIPDNLPAIRWIQRTAADQARVVIDVSTDLNDWAVAGEDDVAMAAATSDGTGFRTLTATITAESARYLRLRVEER